MSGMHFVYMVRCADGTLYTGYTSNLARREKAHNLGRGAKYTAHRLPVSLVYSEECESLGSALRREWQIKHLTRVAKEGLLNQSGAAGGRQQRQPARQARLASKYAFRTPHGETSHGRSSGRMR